VINLDTNCSLMKKNAISRQFICFGFIGSIGFLVDGGVLTLLNSYAGVDLVLSRLCSFSIAVTVTWLLNRHLTFNDVKNKRMLHEWTRYAALNGIGAVINMAIFLWLIFQYEVFAATPLVPLAIASAIALGFNFVVSKYLVFQGSRSREKVRYL